MWNPSMSTTFLYRSPRTSLGKMGKIRRPLPHNGYSEINIRDMRLPDDVEAFLSMSETMLMVMPQSVRAASHQAPPPTPYSVRTVASAAGSTDTRHLPSFPRARPHLCNRASGPMPQELRYWQVFVDTGKTARHLAYESPFRVGHRGHSGCRRRCPGYTKPMTRLCPSAPRNVDPELPSDAARINDQFLAQLVRSTRR